MSTAGEAITIRKTAKEVIRKTAKEVIADLNVEISGHKDQILDLKNQIKALNDRCVGLGSCVSRYSIESDIKSLKDQIPPIRSLMQSKMIRSCGLSFFRDDYLVYFPY